MKKLYLLLLFFLTFNCFSIDNYVYDYENNKINVFLAEKNSNELKLGLEFFLDENWKIYWKYPGDTGLPPNLKMKGENNNYNINIKWPFPEELYEEEINLTSRVYYNYVVLPTSIVFKELLDSSIKKLEFLLDFQICKEICIPVSETFFIDLPTEDYVNHQNIEKLKLFEAKVPKDIKSSKNIKTGNIIIDNNILIVDFEKKNQGEKLKDSKNNLIFLNNNIGTTRFLKEEEDNSKIYYFLSFDNSTEPLKNKSEIFLKINQKYYYWLTSNDIIFKNTINFNILIIILFAFIGGFILNFMPCVLPVLGIKINSFVKELNLKNNRSIKLGSFSIVLGIISTFLFFGIAASMLRYLGKSVGWGMQFQSSNFIMFLILILILFILNLLGFFEIKLPRIFTFFNQTKKDDKNVNMYLKNYFTGILSTLLATPCTAPFVGTAVSVALTQNFLFSILIFLFMAIGKSMPYLIFIVYPQIINFFPKPGKWFVYLKYFFAFLLMLTILWLVNILLSKENNLNENWEKFESTKINEYLSNGNSVFVDITAEWCLSCAVNKKLVLDQRDIQELFTKREIKTLRADWTNRDDAILKFLKTHNKYGIPFNIFYTPDNPKGFIFSEILTKNQVKNAINIYMSPK